LNAEVATAWGRAAQTVGSFLRFVVPGTVKIGNSSVFAVVPHAIPIHVALKTFIVEDNATIRENLVATLEELASVTSVGCAETEDEGTAWLTQHTTQWDLAIVDLFLKQGSGLGILHACRERGAAQKLVVLSNYATPDIRKRCEQLGADAVFDKSNEIDALIDFCVVHAAQA
jgi:two-component system OmpR family response regulator